MIIGVTGSTESKNREISKFLSDKYGFVIVDGDKILEQVGNLYEYKDLFDEDNPKFDEYLLFKLQNEIDLKLIEVISAIGFQRNIVVSYSLLHNSTISLKCDIFVESSDRIEMSVSDRVVVGKSSQMLVDSVHRLGLNMSFNWQEQLSEYINYNLFNDKKVSVVIPVYNTSKYLLRCVNSVKNQTYRNLEIILIDDGSTDESLNICQFLAHTDDRIKVIHQENVGLAETRNRGIDIATGDYICFVDSDDYIECGMVENLLKNSESTNSDVSCVRAFIHLRNGKVEGFGDGSRTIVTTIGTKEAIEAYSDGIISIAAWDKLYRKEALEEIRFDSHVFKEDVDFIYKLCMAGKSFVCDTKEYYHYVKRNDSSLTSKFSTRLFQLREWGHDAYKNILLLGVEYRDVAEKCLFNSLSHILKTYMRDLISGKVQGIDYREDIQLVANDLIFLLLNANNVEKFDDLDNVLDVVNQLQDLEIIDKKLMPTIDVNCIGILWNTLNYELMQEAIKLIGERSEIVDYVAVDLQDEYVDFIYDIYRHNDEFEGIPYFKSCGLVDKYDSNTIVVLNLIVRVSNYIYYNRMKGYLFKEISDLKQYIRKMFKNRIKNYGYDTVFHLTVDEEEYHYTDMVCKKYIRNYSDESNGKK